MSSTQVAAPAAAGTEVADPAAAKQKKMMMLGLGLLAVVIGGIVVYMLFFKKKDEDTPDVPTTGNTTTDAKKTKTVTISNTYATTSNNYGLNLAELELYNGETKLDLRTLGTLTASSALNATQYPLTNLIDGNKATFAHTGTGDFTPKITYTFTTPQTVTKAVVINRQDCCWDRAKGAKLVATNDAGTVLLDATLTDSKDAQTFTFPT